MSSCFRMFSAKLKMTKLLVSGKCKAASASLHEGASKRGRTIPQILVALLLYVLIPSPTILQSDWNTSKISNLLLKVFEQFERVKRFKSIGVYWGCLSWQLMLFVVFCGSWFFFMLFCFYMFFAFLCLCFLCFFALYAWSLLLCLFLMSVAPCISLLLYCCFQQQQQQQQKQQKHQQPKGQIRTTRRTRTTPHALQLFLPCCFQLPFWPFFLRLGVNTMGPRKSKWEVSLYVER